MSSQLTPAVTRLFAAQARATTDAAWFAAVWPVVRTNVVVCTAAAENRALPHTTALELAEDRREPVRIRLCLNDGVHRELRTRLIVGEQRLTVLVPVLERLDATTRTKVRRAFLDEPQVPMAVALLRTRSHNDRELTTAVVRTLVQAKRRLARGDHDLLLRFVADRDWSPVSDTELLAIDDRGLLFRATHHEQMLSPAMARHMIAVTITWAVQNWELREHTAVKVFEDVLHRCIDLRDARSWFTSLESRYNPDELLARHSTDQLHGLGVDELRERSNNGDPRACAALALHPDADIDDQAFAVKILGLSAGPVLAQLDPQRRLAVLCEQPGLTLKHHRELLVGYEAAFVAGCQLPRSDRAYQRWLAENPAALLAEEWSALRSILDRGDHDLVVAAALPTVLHDWLGDDPARWATFVDLAATFTGTTEELLGLCVSLNT